MFSTPIDRDLPEGMNQLMKNTLYGDWLTYGQCNYFQVDDGYVRVHPEKALELGSEKIVKVIRGGD